MTCLPARRRLAPRVRGVFLFVLLLGLGAPTVVAGQVTRDTTRTARPAGPQGERPTPEMMQQQMQMMAPMMGQMMQAMMQAMLTTLARKETADQIATFTKNYYDALVAKGFSREDALKIVMAHGIPSLPTGR